MKEIFEEFYFSSEELRKRLKHSDEYERLRKESEGYYDKLFDTLGEEPANWLDEIFMLEKLMASEWGFATFQAGLKLGMRFMAQAFTDPLAELEK